MVFNPPTLLNYSNADLYAYERRKIQQYNYYLRFRPEIMSHTYIEISYYADLTDNNEIPWYRKIRFIVRSRKKFCSQTSCQNYYPRGKSCQEDDKPRIFKTGDHDIEACQFSCYNLFEHAKMPKDDTDKDNTETEQEQIARAPFLLYSYRQCACTLHDNSIFALGVDDYARTDHHPYPRIDTIGTGFHYIDSGNFFERENFSPSDNEPFIDLDGNESFRFNLNKYYCDDFQLKFDGRKCYASAGEKIFGFLVSSALYKACQYGIRYAATGVTNTDVQKLSLPPPKYKVHHETLISWKEDVDENAFFLDPNVSLTDLGFTEDMKHCIFTTQYGYPGKIVEPKASGKNVTGNLIDYAALNKNRLHQFRYNIETGQRLIDEYEIYGIYKYIRSNPTNETFDQDSYNNPNDKLVNVFKSLAENLDETAAMLILGYMVNTGLGYSAKILHLSAAFLENKITPTLLYIIERELLSQALNPAIKMFSRAIATLARLAPTLIKYVDVFTTIAGIIDLFDIGFDFFNMNNIMDNGTVQQYSELDIEQIKRSYGYGTVEFSPVTFMLMCELLKLHEKWKITPAGTLKLKCIKDFKNYKYMIPVNSVFRIHDDNDNSYEWISEYIFSLRVNSNGLKINWEDEKLLTSDVIEQYLKIDENIYLKGMDEYSKYTETFRKRVQFSKYTLLVLIIVFFIILCIYIKLSVFVIFIAAISSIFIVFSYFLKS